jgi:hypothetical protein
MKQLTLIVAFFVSSITFAHEKSDQEKREMYNAIQLQVEADLISVEEAQRLWIDYIKCCQDT